MNRLGGLLLVVAVVAILAGILVVRLPHSPWYTGLGDDGALFAYGAQRILSGDQLYADVWDTKPPGVFYLNAVAMLVGGANPWTIWWFELFWISVVFLVLLGLLNKLDGLLPAIVTTVLVAFTALHPAIVTGGNFTELYALLPQVLTLGTLVLFFSSGRAHWLIAAGLLTAIAFLIKPTTIALGIAGLVMILVPTARSKDWRTSGINIGLFLAGFILPILIVLIYWSYQGALSALLDAVFGQNLRYVQEGLSVRSLYGTTRKFLLEQPVAILTMFTFTAFFLFRNRTRGSHLFANAERSVQPSEGLDRTRIQILVVVFLALPLEVALVALSGRNFGHYFLTPLPAMAVAISFLFAEFEASVRQFREAGSWYAVSLVLIAGLMVAWGIEIFSEERPRVTQLEDVLRYRLGEGVLIDDLEQYVIENTAPDDTILAWGYQPGLHFVTGRNSPSRYLFHSQLLTPDPSSAARFDQFMDEIESDPPALIVADRWSQHGIPFFGENEFEFCPGCSEEAATNLRRLNKYVQRDYELIEQILSFQIYAPID